VRFVSVGTFDEPDPLPAGGAHLHCVEAALGRAAAGTPAFPEYYKAADIWPAESLERRETLLAKQR
jgi:hypothetical protein